MKLRWAVMAIFVMSALSASGATVSNQRVTTQPPPASGCVVPPSTPSFLTSQGTVYLYFEQRYGFGRFNLA